jgi:hypothetical protein
MEKRASECERGIDSAPYRVLQKMRAVALLSLVLCRHVRMALCTGVPMLGVGFHAVPFDHENNASGIFDAGEKSNPGSRHSR